MDEQTIANAERITRLIRGDSSRLAKLSTERYRARAEGNATALASVERLIERAQARKAARVSERNALRGWSW